jgi:3-hexulose-6-phosphate synthase
MTSLQVAIDVLPIDELEATLAPLLDYVDVLEAGTPFIKMYGLGVVERLRGIAPRHLIVADMKAMDAGALEANMAFDAGADVMTVLACASDATIEGAIRVANERGKRVVCDLIGVPDKVARAKQLAFMAVHLVGVHTGTDDQARGADPLADLAAITAATEVPVVVAGGINQQTLPAILGFKPAIVIAGSGILGQPDPVAAAKALHDAIGAGRS